MEWRGRGRGRGKMGEDKIRRFGDELRVIIALVLLFRLYLSGTMKVRGIVAPKGD